MKRFDKARVVNQEITLDKILDGYPLVYHLASQVPSRESDQDWYWVNIEYNFPVDDDNFTENLTMVGNTNYWTDNEKI